MTVEEWLTAYLALRAPELAPRTLEQILIAIFCPRLYVMRWTRSTKSCYNVYCERDSFCYEQP